jgi:uncharacterized protein
MKKLLRFLSLLLPLLVALTSVFAASFLYLMLHYQIYLSAAAIHGLLGNTDISLEKVLIHLPAIPPYYLDAMTFLQPVIWIFIFYFWYRKLIKKDRKMNRKITSKDVMILVLVGLGCQLTITGLMEIILPYFEELTKEYEELMGLLNYGNPILIFVSVVILAPVAEELIFRGVIFRQARGFMNVMLANFLQALLFGIFHMNLVQGLYAFGGGLALGYIAYKYGTIFAPILLHIFFNGLSYLLFTPQSLPMKIVFTVIGILILILSLNMVHRRHGKEQEYESTGGITL